MAPKQHSCLCRNGGAESFTKKLSDLACLELNFRPHPYKMSMYINHLEINMVEMNKE